MYSTDFKNLTEKDIEKIKEIYLDSELPWDNRMTLLSQYIGKSERTVNRWLAKLGISESSQPESPQFELAKEYKYDTSKKCFIITWAQNDTPVHPQFFSNIIAYSKKLNAGLHIIAGRYKNPTSVFTDRKYDHWADETLEYLDASRHELHKYLWIMSDVKIQPTAVNPMTGLQGMSGVNSCIFGSPKVQLETIPAPNSNFPKMMLTTGACTISNYTDSKSGKKGEFHHQLGFAIVEIQDDEVYFVRQVTALDNGNFTDLIYNVSYNFETDSSVISEALPPSAIIMGDIHYGQHDPLIIEKTLEFAKLVKPKYIVMHDVFDGLSINHHDSKDPIIQYHRELNGTNSLKCEINYMLSELEKFKDFKVVIVRSNHDNFIDRWIKETDWRKASTLKNSLEYMEYCAVLLRGDAPNGLIPYIINQRFPNFITLKVCDSFIINGWEVGLHGDIGFNGSRGSIEQFRKMNTKIIVGHSHTPSRKDGAISVGTSSKLRVNYNIGPSNWLQSHIIINRDGKAQHILFNNGKFTTLFD